MIARIFERGGSFRKVCRYICREQAGSHVIDLDGVRGHDFELMARDFEMVRGLRSEVSKPVFHAVLDFHPKERPDDCQLKEIAQKYLKGIDLTDTQYAVVRHTRTSHMHLHLVANRIDYDGNPIDNFPEILKSRDIAKQLIAEYGLAPVEQKNLRQTNFDALDNSETRLYTIYRCVHENLPGCRSLEDLEKRLNEAGIDTRYRIDKENGERLGISFRYRNEAFKGGQVDKEFTLPRIVQRLERQLKMTVWENEKLSLRKAQMQQEAIGRAQEVLLVKEQKQQHLQERSIVDDMSIQRQVHRMKIH